MDEKRLFGEIAIERGFINRHQLREALHEQREGRRRREGQKLIGVILVELGHMTPEQVFSVLETYEAEKATREGAGSGVRQVAIGHDTPSRASEPEDTVPMGDEPPPSATAPTHPGGLPQTERMGPHRARR